MGAYFFRPVFLITLVLIGSCTGDADQSLSTSSLLTYSSQELTEDPTNDGTFNASITITVKGTEFNQNLVDGVDYGTTNLVPGLTATFTPTSETQGILTIAGQALFHSFCAPTEASFFFTPSAFVDNSLPLAFEVPLTFFWETPGVIISATELNERSVNDGRIQETITITAVGGGTFQKNGESANPGDNLVLDTDFKWDGLPSGFTPDVEIVSSTEIEISVTGPADLHTPLEDVTTEFRMLTAGLSTGFCTDKAKTEIDFKFYRSILMYSVSTPGGTGNLISRLSANDACQDVAPNLPEEYTNFIAFYADNTADLSTDYPADFNIPTNVNVEGFNSVRISSNWAGMFDGTIDNSFAAAEVLNGDTLYWTGANGDGTVAADTCSNWTDGTVSADGTVGDSDNRGTGVSGDWLDNGTPAPCDDPAVALICLAYIPTP